jgi:hypothetical protein
MQYCKQVRCKTTRLSQVWDTHHCIIPLHMLLAQYPKLNAVQRLVALALSDGLDLSAYSCGWLDSWGPYGTVLSAHATHCLADGRLAAAARALTCVASMCKSSNQPGKCVGFVPVRAKR